MWSHLGVFAALWKPSYDLGTRFLVCKAISQCLLTEQTGNTLSTYVKATIYLFFLQLLQCHIDNITIYIFFNNRTAESEIDVLLSFFQLRFVVADVLSN